MNTKLYLSTALLLLAQWSNAQKKVGIGTESPKQTLDVEGTMRIKELGPAKKNDILAWDEATQQVVITPTSNDKYPFYYVNIFIPVAIPNSSNVPQGVNVQNLPIRINPNKYDITVVSANLINTRGKGKSVSNSREYYHSNSKSDYSVNFPIVGGNINNNQVSLFPIIARNNPNDLNIYTGISGRVLVDTDKDNATDESKLLLPDGTYLLNMPNPSIKLEGAKNIKSTPGHFEDTEWGPRFVPGKEIWDGTYKNYYNLSITFPNVTERFGRGFMPWVEGATGYTGQQEDRNSRYAWVVTIFVMDKKWIKD